MSLFFNANAIKLFSILIFFFTFKALVIKSKTKLILKHTSLRDKDWFEEHKWKDVEIFDFENQDIIGMFEKDQKVYAVIKSNESELFEYKVSGPHGLSRQFIQQV